MSAENLNTFENPENRHTYRHTASHILAQAVKRLYPEVKLAIGPAIDSGFYYDFDAPFPITPEILEKLRRSASSSRKSGGSGSSCPAPRRSSLWRSGASRTR